MYCYLLKQDFHCNPLILHQIAVRNQQHGHGTSAPGLPQPPPAHPGYAQNAALLAIRRHAVNYVVSVLGVGHEFDD